MVVMKSNTYQYSNALGATLAFAIVVMGVLLSVFVTIKTVTTFQIAMTVVSGILYVFFGIYGFSLASKSERLFIRLSYFAIQLMLGGLLLYLSQGVDIAPLLLFPLAGQAVLALPPRPMIAINSLIGFCYIMIMRNFANQWVTVLNSLPWYLIGQIFMIIFLQTGLEEDKAHQDNMRLLRELELANHNLQEYASQIEEFTLTRERNRIAREIHDGVGHYLTVINMQIQAAMAVMDTRPERAKQTLDRAASQAKEALKEIRSSITVLRDQPDENIPLETKLKRQIQQMEDSQVKTHLNILGDIPVLPSQFEHTIYRTVQEGIQNCIKHSKASNLWITLDYTKKGKIQLEIRDDGRGAESGSNGFGLTSLRERVVLQKGEFRSGDHPSGGFYITVEVPYERDSETTHR